jgi:hypothetical protein
MNRCITAVKTIRQRRDQIHSCAGELRLVTSLQHHREDDWVMQISKVQSRWQREKKCPGRRTLQARETLLLVLDRAIEKESCSWHTSTLDTIKMKLGSDKEPHPFRVLYIGPSKRLNDYYAPMAYYIKNCKGRVAGSDAAHRIDPSVFNLPLMQPPRWCHVHHMSLRFRKSSG